MVQIPNLTVVTTIAGTDLIVVEDVGTGTRRITRDDALPRGTDLAALTPPNINLADDLIGIFDATDGRLKGVTAFNLLFGNYTNLAVTDDFTLSPVTHGSRSVECQGTFTTSTVTLDGNVTDVGGNTFVISNFTTVNLTLSRTNIILFENSATVTSAIIRENTTATIVVNNAATEAIFSGG